MKITPKIEHLQRQVQMRDSQIKSVLSVPRVTLHGWPTKMDPPEKYCRAQCKGGFHNLSYNFSPATLSLQSSMGSELSYISKYWLGRRSQVPRYKPRSWSNRKSLPPWWAHTLFLLLKARARTLQLSGFVSSLGMSFKALWVMWAYTGTRDTLCLASLLVNTSSVTSQSPIEPSREPTGQGDHRCQT